jgi:hypothetical protein
VPYVRTVKTSSGAVAVQIVYSFHRGSRQIEHIGSAHDDAGVELLKAVARQRLAAGQGVLELGPGFGAAGGAALPITSSRMVVLLDALEADRARRTLRGIDGQVNKAEQAVAGETPVKRNRFVQLSGGTKTVNRSLEEKARALAGLKGYVTNLQACPDGTKVTPEFVISAYHQLFQAEKSFRMAKSDLQARPVYHHLRDSIEAHLTIVFAALAVSRWIENTTGWSIRRLVRTARRRARRGHDRAAACSGRALARRQDGRDHRRPRHLQHHRGRRRCRHRGPH